MRPVRADVTLRCDATVDAAAEALCRAIAEMGGHDVTFTRDEMTLNVASRFGSRLRYRLWGVYLRRGRAAMPFRVEAKLVPDDADASLAQIAACSDEGFMVARVPRVETAYRSLLATVVQRLRETLTHLSSGPV